MTIIPVWNKPTVRQQTAKKSEDYFFLFFIEVFSFFFSFFLREFIYSGVVTSKMQAVKIKQCIVLAPFFSFFRTKNFLATILKRFFLSALAVRFLIKVWVLGVKKSFLLE